MTEQAIRAIRDKTPKDGSYVPALVWMQTNINESRSDITKVNNGRWVVGLYDKDKLNHDPISLAYDIQLAFAPTNNMDSDNVFVEYIDGSFYLNFW